MPSVKLPETATFQIAAGPAVSVRISAPDQIRAGEEFTISIYAQDKFGNATEQFEDSVDLEIVGEKPQTFKATFSKGYSEVTVQWTKAETLTLKVTSSVLTSCDPQQLLVLPGPPVQLLVESPKLAVAGEAIPVVVKAVDQFGNLATDFKGEISLGLTVRAS